MFSQRYQTLEAETTAAIVFSTLGFVAHRAALAGAAGALLRLMPNPLPGRLGDILAQRLPQVLGRVELGAVRRQEDQPHVLRHDQFAGEVPAGLVHDHEDELLGVALCDLARNSDIVSALTQGSTRLSITPSCGLTALKA